MAHIPHVPAVPAKKLGACQEKRSPAVKPSRGKSLLPVDFLEDPHHLVSLRVHPLEPSLERKRVMLSVDAPVIPERQLFLEVQQEVIARHGAAAEEIATHPIPGSLINEMVRVIIVHEDVHKE